MAQDLVSLRALTAHLRRRFGDADAEQIRADALAGHLPCVRVGDALGFSIPDVEAALLERARKAPNGGAT